MEPGSLLGLPFQLTWLRKPERWEIDAGALTIQAGRQTDWFIDPAGDLPPMLNAPALVGAIAGDFMLQARVSVDFGATFDAGVLMLHADDRCWAKLCFELSPQGLPMVVSVVTREHSDDCNSRTVDGADLWLRVARLGAAFAFHSSSDGHQWELVRYFDLPGASVSVGFEAQSPLGEGCVATFSDIGFTPGRLADLRSGV
jgi:regulation of enolase protein 1 (concanavalin A-like superfamily)